MNTKKDVEFEKEILEEKLKEAELLIKELTQSIDLDNYSLENIFCFFNKNSEFQGSSYSRVGGEIGVYRLALPVIDFLLNNKKLGKYFEGKNVAKLVIGQIRFMLDGPNSPSMDELTTLHKGLKIKEEDFYEYIVGLSDVFLKLKLNGDIVEGISAKIKKSKDYIIDL